MESQPQNPEFRINPENFHLCILFPTSGDFCIDNCCHLLITLVPVNSLNPDQARQNVGPDLDPSCLTLRWYPIFFEKVTF